MKISFQKKQGNTGIGVEFFWSMTIDGSSPGVIRDHFIPELFYDYFMVKRGNMHCIDEIQKTEFDLPQQSLKTLYTRPLTFILSAPLVLFGARLSLKFAESFWDEELRPNSFMEQRWVDASVGNLASFAAQVTEIVRRHHKPKFIAPVFSSALQESAWLACYSPRHKRRLYKSTFGVSRKEMLSIQNVHSFLEQSCDFSSENPRIIRHLNPDVFYDQPHLNRVFKKTTGLAPVDYFEHSSILQDNLMSASYNEDSTR